VFGSISTYACAVSALHQVSGAIDAIERRAEADRNVAIASQRDVGKRVEIATAGLPDRRHSGDDATSAIAAGASFSVLERSRQIEAQAVNPARALSQVPADFRCGLQLDGRFKVTRLSYNKLSDTGVACVGLLMMVGTIGVLDAYYPGGMITLFATGTAPNAADEALARTMAFTTLMMYQLFDVYNCRSRRRSAFIGLLDNKWLLVAIAFSLGTHILVIHVPALQVAFHTVPLSLRDWAVSIAVASALLFAMEIAKVALRARDVRRAAAPASAGAAVGSYRAAE